MKFIKEQPEKLFEREINPHIIAIVTTTFYPKWSVKKEFTPDHVRGDLAIGTLEIAKSKGYQMVIIDGGSSDAFIEQLRQKGIVPNNEKVKGMSAGRQQGFEEASKFEGVKVICWTEPEKIFIVNDCLPEAVRPILDGRADIVVPKRDSEAWKTYPQYQAELEQHANKLWNAILKKRGFLSNEAEDLDVWFGPKFFKNDPELVKIFL